MEKTLVIVPHEDDELSVAGSLLVSLSKDKENQNYIVFTTNGDAFAPYGKMRILEAIKCLQILGVDEDHIIFLGYGSGWNNDRHLINCEGDKKIVSQGGFCKTYSIDSHPEYSFSKYGVHHDYTRNNFKSDLKTLIFDLEPTFIVCVDYDSHPDHKATSLLFEECMGEILKERENYHPIIWKKFAYLGTWDGPRDYYLHNITINAYQDDQTDNPVFCWKNRIRIGVEDSCKTALLRKNIIYRAALCHKTQNAWLNIQKVCNDDAVYWSRNSENILLKAKVSATSGKASCLNDFVITNSSDIQNKELIINHNNIWHPTDDKRTAVFEFDQPVKAKWIVFYESPLPEDNINNITVLVNDECALSTGELDHTGGASIYQLDYLNIRTITIKIDEWEGQMPGLLEVELLCHRNNKVIPNGLEEYEDTAAKKRGDIFMFAEYWMLRLKAFWKTVLFPDWCVMIKKYPVLLQKKILLPFFWVLNWVYRK